MNNNFIRDLNIYELLSIGNDNIKRIHNELTLLSNDCLCVESEIYGQYIYSKTNGLILFTISENKLIGVNNTTWDILDGNSSRTLQEMCYSTHQKTCYICKKIGVKLTNTNEYKIYCARVNSYHKE